MSNVHLIIDEDDYLVNETAKSLYGDGTGLEVVDSITSTNAELQLKDLSQVDLSFSTPPFLEPVKVTWWKNVAFLPRQGKGGPSEEVREALERFAKKIASAPPADNQLLLISGPKLSKASTFVKNLGASAELHMAAPAKGRAQEASALARVRDFAAKENLKFAPGADELFVRRVGADTRSLMSEIAKMRDYLGGEHHTVDAEAIAAITSQGVGVEPNLWSVTDALGARNLAKALDALRQFEGDSGFAVFMTTVIEGFFRQLAELKDAQMRGRLAEATAGTSPWVAQKNERSLGNWRLDELRLARSRFASLRERAVSSSDGIDDLVVAEVVRACRKGASR